MTIAAVILLALGFVASWVAGRHIERGATLIQGGAIGVCGVAALLFGMPELFARSPYFAIAVLLIYGVIGAFIFRSGQIARKNDG